MKIISAYVKVLDDKNHVKFLSLDDVDITIKGQAPSIIMDIPKIPESIISKAKKKITSSSPFNKK